MRRAPRWGGAASLLVALALALGWRGARGAALEAQRERTVEESWDFNDGLEGWANATTEEGELETYARGGELRGNVRGATPHLDSPRFWTDASDKHYVVLRLAYAGFRASARGKIWVRFGNSQRERVLDSVDYTSTTWDAREYVELSFAMVADAAYHTYYVPIHAAYSGPITQLRVFPAVPLVAGDVLTTPSVGHTLRLDWVRIAKAPTVWRVEGCTRLRSDPARLAPRPPSGWPAAGGAAWSGAADAACVHSDGRTNATRMERHCNRGVGAKYFSASADAAAYIAAPNLADGTLPRPSIDALQYATAFNCLRRGGERVVITGINFGASGAIVTIGGEPCRSVVHADPATHADAARPERQLTCTLPPALEGADGAHETGDARTHVAVVVTNGVLPGLYDSPRYLAYAARPPPVATPAASNIAASALDVSWPAPSDYWEAVPITGYEVAVHEVATARRWTVVVGNVTTTTLVGLAPAQRYEVHVRALAEDQTQSDAWLHVDLYGRRRAAPDAVRSIASAAALNVTTLPYDVHFAGFDANSTLDHDALDHRASRGALSVDRGEGHFGVTLVGSASVENCNATTSCCDGFSTPGAPCGTVCGVVAGDADDDIVVGDAASLYRELRNRPVLGCGPALRLTGSSARQSGAAWYTRQQQLREGFDTTFTFRISQPSFTCKSQDDVFTHCRSRGADGFAFVVHNSPNAKALGRGGRGIGYDGIENSIAVEFDTWYNPELLDACVVAAACPVRCPPPHRVRLTPPPSLSYCRRYENHVAVHSRGWRHPNSANASYALATATWAPRFADADYVHSSNDSMPSGARAGAEHVVRIRYSPIFDEAAMLSDRFAASAHVASFMENGQFGSGAMGEWGTGMGTLSVFLDDVTKPLLVLPLNLGALIDTTATDGRAWVGFTAATGDSHWQAHDITQWEFASTRIDLFDDQRAGSPLVNGVGAHACTPGAPGCLHP